MISIKIVLDDERHKEVTIGNHGQRNECNKPYFYRKYSPNSGDWARRRETVYNNAKFNDGKTIRLNYNSVYDRLGSSFDEIHPIKHRISNKNSYKPYKTFSELRSQENPIIKTFGEFANEKISRGSRASFNVRLRKETALARKKIAALSINNDTVTKVYDSASNASTVQESLKTARINKAILKYDVARGLSNNRTDAPPPQEQQSSTSVSTQTDSKPIEPSKNLEKSLLESYRCSLCEGYMVPELYECSGGGHTSCEECWLTISRCAVCNAGYRRVRTLENLARLLAFPCRWRANGCQESLAAHQWREHVAECSYSEQKAITVCLRNAMSESERIAQTNLPYYGRPQEQYGDEDDYGDVELIDSDEE